MSKDTSDAPNSNVGGKEPSMEDILASIRRIIADDEVEQSDELDAELGQALEPIEELTPTVANENINLLDADGESFSDVLTDVNFLEKEPIVDDTPLELNDVAEDVLEDISADTEIQSDISNESTDIKREDASLALDTETHTKNGKMTSDDDIISQVENLLDLDGENLAMDENITSPDNEIVSADVVNGAGADDRDPLSTLFEDEANLQSPSGDSDLDLVKSLMADLTDDSFLTPDNVDKSAAVDDVPEAEFVGEAMSVSSEPSSDEAIVDDVLNKLADDDASVSLEKPISQTEDPVVASVMDTEPNVSENNVIDEVLDLTLDDELVFQEAMQASGDPETEPVLEENPDTPEATTPVTTAPVTEMTDEDILELEAEDLMADMAEVEAVNKPDDIADVSEVELKAVEAEVEATELLGDTPDVSEPAVIDLLDDTAETTENVAATDLIAETLGASKPVPEVAAAPTIIEPIDEIKDTEPVQEHRSLSQIAADALDDAVDMEEQLEPTEKTEKQAAAAMPIAAVAAASVAAAAGVATHQNIATPEKIEAPALLVPSPKVDTPPLKESPVMPTAAVSQDAIISDVTEEATFSAFASLNNLVESNTEAKIRGDRIGDLVTEALKPMLREWLDANLQGIVEHAVTREVQRISSGK